jgi:hypothetical protein
MPSRSLFEWQNRRRLLLDEVEDAHRSVGGVGPGRRHATEQINQAYAVLLSAHFQAYCRDLHSECADYLVRAVPAALADMFLAALMWNRKLDHGNPNAGNLGSDFGRFELNFWADVEHIDHRNEVRRELLDELNLWRNAIAHQDFDPVRLGAGALQLRQVRTWRAACQQLALDFDEVMRSHLERRLGGSPW